MPDQNHLDAFLAGKAAAEGRRQTAIREAHRAFDKAFAEEKARHARRYHAASAAFDAVKSTPDIAGYDEVRQAFEIAKEPADHRKARAELDRAIKAADEAYQTEIARLGQEHGVTVR